MNYQDVRHTHSVISAINSQGKEVVIDKSIANLYHCKIANKETGKIHHDAITYMDRQTLRLVENFIRGDSSFSRDERETLRNIVVRFGWLDKTLNQLIWMSLVDLVEKFVRKELKGTEKSKFQEICKQLSLSLRDARELHLEGALLYNPRVVLLEKDREPPKKMVKLDKLFVNKA